MSKNICKQALNRELGKDNKILKINRINPESRYGYVYCKKHDNLICFLTTYKGCNSCKKEQQK